LYTAAHTQQQQIVALCRSLAMESATVVNPCC
jgi:hypothetical protein